MRSPLLLPLLLCMAVPSLGRSARAESVDLTSYLAPRPAAGDYRTYVSRWPGGEYEQRYDVTEVGDVGSGWLVEWALEDAGLSDYDELVRPGARVRRATRNDSPPPGCRQAIHHQLRSCDLRMRLGQKHPVRFRDIGMDPPVSFIWYLSKIRGSYRAEGFEPVETP